MCLKVDYCGISDPTDPGAGCRAKRPNSEGPGPRYDRTWVFQSPVIFCKLVKATFVKGNKEKSIAE